MVEVLTAAVGIAAAAVAATIGFYFGQLRGDSSGHDGALERPAQALGVDPELDAVTSAIKETANAIDDTLDEVHPADRDAVRQQPLEQRARALHEAATTGEFGDSGDERPVSGPDAPQSTNRGILRDAVDSAKHDVRPDTDTGRRLLDYLAESRDADEQQLAATIQSTVEALNRLNTIDDAFKAVQPRVGTDQLVSTLRTQADTLPGTAGEVFRRIAAELEQTERELNECTAARQSLEESAERICTAANEQSAISFDADAPIREQLSTIKQAVDAGELSFRDEQSSVPRVAGRTRQTLSPESTLANEFIDKLTEDRSLDREDFAQTLQEVVDAIDQAETVRHRLEGVNVSDTEQLAGRLVDEFNAVDTRAAQLLRERVADLEKTVSGEETDLVTVYAVRQELRFYDRRLLPELRDNTDAAVKRSSDVKAELESVTERRSSMRTEYPSEYPEHDHSIPIHFLELVASLEEDAEEATRTGNIERAMGYINAADKTLDWVAELYERHAYNVLLEQLRG